MSQLFFHLDQHQNLNVIHISFTVANDKRIIELKANLADLNLLIVKGRPSPINLP